jgi:hypothetical protein
VRDTLAEGAESAGFTAEEQRALRFRREIQMHSLCETSLTPFRCGKLCALGYLRSSFAVFKKRMPHISAQHSFNPNKSIVLPSLSFALNPIEKNIYHLSYSLKHSTISSEAEHSS